MARSTRKKLYLIGIDAAPLWLLEELKDKKGMEPFSKLLLRGQIGNLESTLPPMTGSAWPTIYTGLSPAEHGTPDFFVIKKDYVKDVVYYNSNAHPPFWKAFADRGLKSLVITPATNITLPEFGNIDFISGFPLRSRANSERLRKLMSKHGFDGEPEIEKGMAEGKISNSAASQAYVKSVANRSGMAKEMIEENDYDFVYVCFTETDRIQHFTLGTREKWDYILPVYAEIAKFIAYIEERAKKENALMVIVSDHGAQPMREKFLLNGWLIENGFLVLKESVAKSIGAASKPGAPASYELREKLMRSGLRKTYDKMPYQVKKVTTGFVGKFLANASSGEYTRLHIFDFDMKKSMAFAEVSNGPFATLWINDKRFSSGIVKDSERGKVISEIKRKLGEARSKDGEKLIAGFEDAADYYRGAKTFIPPDLFIEIRKGYTMDIFNYSPKTLFMKPEHAKSGDHIRNGIIGYSGPVKLNIGHASVLDIAPTMLAYFGIKSGTKGRSLLSL